MRDLIEEFKTKGQVPQNLDLIEKMEISRRFIQKAIEDAADGQTRHCPSPVKESFLKKYNEKGFGPLNTIQSSGNFLKVDSVETVLGIKPCPEAMKLHYSNTPSVNLQESPI